MTNTTQPPAENPSCCSGGSCCTGPGKWIWLLLAAAIIAVVVARNLKKPETPPASQPSPAAETNAVPPVPAAPATNAAQGQALPRLVDLGAGKCIPCKMMAPILEDLKKSQAGKFEVQVIDVWENPDAGEKYGIKLIPTQIFYDAAGKELFRHEGFFGKKDILAKWKELGIQLQSSEISSQNDKQPQQEQKLE